MDKKAFFIYAESQIHAGTGTDVGIVDLPIQRERTTGFPVIQGVKGALRSSDLLSSKDEEIFGSKPDTKEESLPGKVNFSEAKMLLFPVRSPQKVFVWVTCPLVIRRFQRLTDIEFDIPEPNNEEAYVCEINKEKIELEEMDFIAKTDNNVKNIAEKLSNSSPDDYMKAKIAKDLVIVSDEMFKNIVKTMTEIVPRIRIGENGVVKQGALWYEEYLPQDTVMYFVCRSEKNVLNGDLDQLDGKVITMGGKESTGKGIVFIKKVI